MSIYIRLYCSFEPIVLDFDEEGAGESGVPLEDASDIVEFSIDDDLPPRETKIC